MAKKQNNMTEFKFYFSVLIMTTVSCLMYFYILYNYLITYFNNLDYLIVVILCISNITMNILWFTLLFKIINIIKTKL